MEHLKHYIIIITELIEFIGILIIFFGVAYSICAFLFSFSKEKTAAYYELRHSLGKSILLGLEILIAADIMQTVNTDPTIRSGITLGIIVLIRTFMSMSLEVELEGRFPWQKSNRITSKEH